MVATKSLSCDKAMRPQAVSEHQSTRLIGTCGSLRESFDMFLVFWGHCLRRLSLHRDVYNHWEIKGRFRKRVVLANIPLFRFSFRGNIRQNHPFGNHPFVNTKKAHWEIKGRFRKRVVLVNVPLFRFSFRGNIRQNHPFGNHPFVNPRYKYNRKAKNNRKS